MQWLFGKRTKCAKKDNQSLEQEVQIKTLTVQESESSDEFELVSNNEEAEAEEQLPEEDPEETAIQ